jgi:signal recognition particle subunit SRP68
LTLIQHATLHLRETRSVLSAIVDISTPADTSYPLPAASLDVIESSISAASLSTKNEWFAYNGGRVDGDPKGYKKPLFFDIALNYVQLDMNRLLERAGKMPQAPTREKEEREVQPAKSRLEEVVRPETPEPQVQDKGGLSGLLGGWWGRK